VEVRRGWPYRHRVMRSHSGDGLERGWHKSTASPSPRQVSLRPAALERMEALELLREALSCGVEMELVSKTTLRTSELGRRLIAWVECC